ncbi:hypothetical protein CKY02_18490 [Photorhabdus bodei]|uniref:Uncharacterized protein n=1 Tax=Photorhabdus bodei TaxID=2029681 RepID=A0A329WVV6_9GAMM|nr:hypothetical protein CKY02_18490 [Photorhabdus bodei]
MHDQRRIPGQCAIHSYKPQSTQLNSKKAANYAAFNTIPVILQVASLLAALTHPGHIVIYAPGDLLPCRRDAS